MKTSTVRIIPTSLLHSIRARPCFLPHPLKSLNARNLNPVTSRRPCLFPRLISSFVFFPPLDLPIITFCARGQENSSSIQWVGFCILHLQKKTLNSTLKISNFNEYLLLYPTLNGSASGKPEFHEDKRVEESSEVAFWSSQASSWSTDKNKFL